MLKLYNLIIQIFSLAIKAHALFNNKSREWKNGRKDLFKKLNKFKSNENEIVWFHCASLGEYEQAREIIKRYKMNFQNDKVLLTFFSPSGLNNFKNNTYIDFVSYLPIDTQKNVKKFLKIVKPKIAIFIKSEFWFNFLNQLSLQKIPTLHIASVFNKNNFVLKNNFTRKIIEKSSHFFVQDVNSKEILNSFNITNVTVCGDPRIDSIISNNKLNIQNEEIKKFCEKKTTIIFASVWPEDEHIFVQYIRKNPQYNYLIAPHEISYCNRISKKLDVEFLSNPDKNTEKNTLLINKIGILKNIYKYCSIAYIGGGFGKGIHNTLEVVSNNIPVIFGPNYKKFNEAHDLIKQNSAKSINNILEFSDLINNQKSWFDIKKTQKYFEENQGSAQQIIEFLIAKKL